MSLGSTIKIALKAIYQNKLRSALTMLGIIIGIASVVIIVSVGQGTAKSIENRIYTVIGGIDTINIMPKIKIVKGVRKGLAKTLTFEDAIAIENECPLVIHSSPLFPKGVQVVYGNENCSFGSFGVSENYAKIKNWEVLEGNFFTEEDVENGNQVCVLGHKVFEDLFHNKDSIGQFIRLNNIPFRVVGVMKKQGGEINEDDWIFIPYTTYRSRIQRIRNVFSIYCSITSYEYIDEIKEDIRSILRQRHNLQPEDEDDFKVNSIDEQTMEIFTGTTKTLTLFLLVIASISLLVGGIGIMNIMLVSVNERIREIGIRMSLGARRIDILKQFLLESMTLSIIGGVIGIIIGIVISQYIPKFFPDLSTIISLEAITISFLFSAGVGIFFGFYPALQASKLDPIVALRNESDYPISIVKNLKDYKGINKLVITWKIIKAICSSKIRDFLAILGIIIGVASVITMINIGQGVSKSITDYISSLGTNLVTIESKGRKFIKSYETLTIEDCKNIEYESPFVIYSSPILFDYLNAIYENKNCDTAIYGVSEKYNEIKNLTISQGIFFTEEDVENGNKVCVISEKICKELFNGEYPIDQFIRLNKIPFKVIGVLKEKVKIKVELKDSNIKDRDDLILIPYTAFRSRINRGENPYKIICSITSETDTEEAIDDIKLILRQGHKLQEKDNDDFTINTQISIKELYEKTTDSFTLLLSSIAFISLLVGGIGIMNVMLVSVTARTKEIGIRMSVGARRSDILKQFLFESMQLSITGGIIGIILGIVISQYVPHFFPNLSTIISIEAIIISFLFSVGVGIFFGFYPAWQASKLDPIEALRYE